MELKKKYLNDFVLEYYDMMKLYPQITKKSAIGRLSRLKKKLNKPNGGVLLASEYCNCVGISFSQLCIIIKPLD
jgi:hypothetical protein